MKKQALRDFCATFAPALATFFQTKSYTTVCGPHWKLIKRDVPYDPLKPDTQPDQIAAQTISVKQLPDHKPLSGKIIPLNLEIRSLMPSHVKPTLGMVETSDLNILKFIKGFFPRAEIGNSWLDFDTRELTYVIKQDGWYIHLSMKFVNGHF